MNLFVQIVMLLVLVFFLFQVAYLVFFSLAATFSRAKKIPLAGTQKRISILIPAYKEDKVIINTAQAALLQDYPAHLFEVIVIADSCSNNTLRALKALPVTVIEASFEKSTKGKALQLAAEYLQASPPEMVLVLDADNIMSRNFLQAVNNGIANGFDAVQAHRTAKENTTAFSLLDACTEEINNHIFRRGHVAVGLPSALIGSGMAFRWNVLYAMLQNIGNTAGEDKAFEFMLLKQGKRIAFLDGVYVYDEKVSKAEVFTKQRSRWLAMQIEFFVQYFFEGWRQLLKGNFSFFEKLMQQCLLPRVMLVTTLCGWTLACYWFAPHLLLVHLYMLCALAVALLLGIPASWFGKKLLLAFLQIPVAILGFFTSLFHLSKARQSFIHTPHGDAGT